MHFTAKGSTSDVATSILLIFNLKKLQKFKNDPYRGTPRLQPGVGDNATDLVHRRRQIDIRDDRRRGRRGLQLASRRICARRRNVVGVVAGR